MGDQARAVVQQTEEAGLDDLPAGQLEGGAEHHVGHPELVGQGALEGLGGTALRRDGWCLMERASNWWAARNRYTEGRLKVPGLERALLEELAHQHLDRELGILLPAQSRMAWHASGLSALRVPLSLRGLALQGVKTLVAPKVIPALQRGGRIGFAAPGPFAGQSGGSGQREVLL